jgi:hypothetical protein
MKNFFCFFSTVAKARVDYTVNYGFKNKAIFDKGAEPKPSRDEINNDYPQFGYIQPRRRL